MMADFPISLQVGDLVGPVQVGAIAHGGHCVARVGSWVIFVRHALPGETVQVRITARRQRYGYGDAVAVLDAHPQRVPPPCPVARPGGCGGCDFQHASLPLQRQLKAAVVAEQLERLAGYHWTGEVEAVPADTGQGWRTRMRYRVSDDHRLGLRRHRGHDLVELPEAGCWIAHPGLRPVPGPALTGATPGAEVVQAGVDGAVLVAGEVVAGPSRLLEQAAGFDFHVEPDGFWQVHPAAADILVTAVREGLGPLRGESAWDLYCGVGLFARMLVAQSVTVRAVEWSRPAVALARRNVARARTEQGRVERVIRRWPGQVDLVVLDPPRSGCGATVVAEIVRRRPRRVAYVACDPAALARDLADFAIHGYQASEVRAFDLFPMTHHVECLAVLEPDESR